MTEEERSQINGDFERRIGELSISKAVIWVLAIMAVSVLFMLLIHETGWVVAAGIVMFIIAMIVGVVKGNQIVKQAAEMRMRASAKFKCDDLYVTISFPIKCVGVSFQERKLILGMGASIFAYEFSKITAAEVVENGATVTHTNRGSQLLGAAVGGAVFGGFGAVVGGLSGSSRSQSLVTSLYLKITIDDRANPVWLICFFNDGTKKGSDPNGILVRSERPKLERMYAHVLNAMKKSQAIQATPAPTLFSADELRKLWDLMQAGILTEEEYERQKARLIDGPNQAARGNEDPEDPSLLLGDAPMQFAAVAEPAPPPTKVCPSCRSSIPVAAWFCDYCGVKSRTQSSPPRPLSTTLKGWEKVVLGVAASVVILALCIWITQR